MQTQALPFSCAVFDLLPLSLLNRVLVLMGVGGDNLRFSDGERRMLQPASGCRGGGCSHPSASNLTSLIFLSILSIAKGALVLGRDATIGN